MTDLFGDPGEDARALAVPAVTDVRPLTPQQRLAGEKETLGLYLSGHPIDAYEAELRQFAPSRLRELRASRNVQVLAGLIVDVRVIRTRQGDPIAFVTLDDRSGRMEIVLRSELLEANREKIASDRILVVEGEVGVNDRSGEEVLQVRRAHALYTITEARRRYARDIELALSADQLDADFPDRLQRLLAGYRGEGCSVAVRYRRCDAEARLRFGDAWRVEPSDDLLERLREEAGVDTAELRYADR